MQEIYEPQEDSFLLAEVLQRELKDKEKLSYLDMGCGSCVLSDSVQETGITDITCADINLAAVDLAKKKGYKGVQTDLFENVKDSFDVISFNAPYLPEDEREPEESKVITTGGKKGDEIPLKFLKQAKSHLKENGVIYLLISSLTPMSEIDKLYTAQVIARKKIFFEELLVLKIKK